MITVRKLKNLHACHEGVIAFKEQGADDLTWWVDHRPEDLGWALSHGLFTQEEMDYIVPELLDDYNDCVLEAACYLSEEHLAQAVEDADYCIDAYAAPYLTKAQLSEVVNRQPEAAAACCIPYLDNEQTELLIEAVPNDVALYEGVRYLTQGQALKVANTCTAVGSLLTMMNHCRLDSSLMVSVTYTARQMIRRQYVKKEAA